MGKRKIHIVVMLCLVLSLCASSSALAVCIPFDMRTNLKPINLKPGDSGIQPYGTYIASGSCEISKIGTGEVRISASTSCYRTASTVTADVYLESKEGGSWWTYTYKLGTGYNTNYVSTYKDVAVPRKQYYRVSGGHMAKVGGVTETSISTSGSMYID